MLLEGPVTGMAALGSLPHSLSLPQFLAMVFQDLLTNKDDYLRASRALLREIIKQTKHEINFQAFCLGLMQERKEPQYLEMEFKVPAPAAGVPFPHCGSPAPPSPSPWVPRTFRPFGCSG